MSAGRSSVDIALYTLIPVMVVMMVMMKYLESVGVLAKLVNVVAPVLKPFGLTGLSLFALIQLNFVSFAAPVAMMEKKGASDRHLAATLAMLFAMGQANALYPLAPLGLHWITTVLLSIVGGLAAGAVTWYLPGRRLASKEVISTDDAQVHAPQKAGLLSIINGAGGESIRLSLGAVPMLILSLTIVGIIKSVGGISLLEQALSPVMQTLNIPAVLIMPALVKCLAGGTAYLGVTTELLKNGHMSVETLNASAGWLLQTFDLPGVGIMLGAGFRVARIAHFAIPGALLGIALRGILHAIVY